MYKVRKFVTKNANIFEKIYYYTAPLIITALSRVKKQGKMESVITFIEKHTKSFLFDCQMCGECVLSSTGMTCPMVCPKQMRNGPCGGVRDNGNCEVVAKMKCVWVEAWHGASLMQHNKEIQEIHFALNSEYKNSSAWLRLARREKNNAA